MKIKLYGLRIEINADLGRFPICDEPGDVDVTVVLGHLGPFAHSSFGLPWSTWYASSTCGDDGTPDLQIRHLSSGHFWWQYRDRTEFLIDKKGAEVYAIWATPATEADTLTYLFGAVLGFVLRLRGTICLHGCAVAVGRYAIVMTGKEGSGKSTTGAALARRGLPVLTDDVAALDDRHAHLHVTPGPPRLLLLSSSVQGLWGAADSLPRLSPTWEKYVLDLRHPLPHCPLPNPSRLIGEGKEEWGEGAHYCHVPMPLGAIYVLGYRKADLDRPTFRTLSGPEGLIRLVANTFANKLLDAAMRAQEFELLTRLIRHVPVREVHAPLGLARLGNLCEGILEDCQRLGLS